MNQESTRKTWLEDSIEEYIKKNPGVDSVDITSYFKLSMDIIFESIYYLTTDGKIFRRHTYGFNYGYFCKNKPIS